MFIAILTTLLSTFNCGAQTDTLQLKADKAIKNSLHFLQSKRPIKSQNLLMLLQYLEKNYGIADDFEVNKYLRQEPVYDDEKEQMKFFGRLYGKKSNFKKEDLEHLTGVVKLMAWSINADRFKPDKTYFDDLWNYSGNLDRDLPHAALCLAWMREQGLDRSIPNSDSLYKLQVKNLLALAEKEDYTNDTGLEALVGLIRLEKSDSIQGTWINKIIDAQNKDGGWCIIPTENGISNEHSTILALWVLVDFKNRGKAVHQWIEK